MSDQSTVLLRLGVFNPEAYQSETDRLDQGLVTWGTCTPRGTFAFLKGYIYCTAATNLILRDKNGVYLHSSKNIVI